MVASSPFLCLMFGGSRIVPYICSMSKFRIWLGEWLHILADKVLPIPAFAKSGTHIGKLDDYVLLEHVEIVEGRDILLLAQEHGVDVDTAKASSLNQAKRNVVARILYHIEENVTYNVIKHGTKERTYFEVRGRLLIHKRQLK